MGSCSEKKVDNSDFNDSIKIDSVLIDSVVIDTIKVAQ
jgi:hypothetical protein